MGDEELFQFWKVCGVRFRLCVLKATVALYEKGIYVGHLLRSIDSGHHWYLAMQLMLDSQGRDPVGVRLSPIP